MIALLNRSSSRQSVATQLQHISACSYELIDTTPAFRKNLEERTPHNGVGDVLSESYEAHKEEYEALPKSKEEAAARGETNYDGLQVSVRPFASLDNAELSPIRYSFLNAYKRARQELIDSRDNFALANLEQENPFVIGAAVYAVCEFKGKPCLMMQIKGNATGRGQIHPPVAAGGISMEEFQSNASTDEMFIASAVRQTQEELGLDISRRNLDQPSLVRYENATGNMAIGYILKGLKGSDLLDAYTDHVKRRVIASSDDTAYGISLLPTEGTNSRFTR